MAIRNKRVSKHTHTHTHTHIHNQVNQIDDISMKENMVCSFVRGGS